MCGSLNVKLLTVRCHWMKGAKAEAQEAAIPPFMQKPLSLTFHLRPRVDVIRRAVVVIIIDNRIIFVVIFLIVAIMDVIHIPHPGTHHPAPHISPLY